MLSQWLARLLPFVTGAWIAILFLQPAGLLDFLFWKSSGAIGTDYWCIPRGFLNLLHGHSLYDTFNGAQFGGPIVTWYLGHPAFELIVAPWYAFFSPATSFSLWSLTSIALLLCVGAIYAQRAPSRLARSACMFFCVFGVPALCLLASGNMHTWLVLALALVIVGLYDMSLAPDDRGSQRMLAAGLLLSLLSKPIVLFMLPMLLLLRSTRRITLIVIAAYVAVSAVCVLVPSLNPEGIGLQREIALFLDPAYVREHMNIYKNQFVVTAEMKDNAIHWLNLVAQSDFYWNHIQIFSLSAFVNDLTGINLPAAVYKIPLLVALLCSLAVVGIRNRADQLLAATWAVMLLSLTFFLCYNTVWEYQFTAIIPLLLFAIVRLDRGVDTRIAWAILACGVVVAMPSLYFLFAGKPEQANLAWIRSTRVLPVFALYCLMLWQLVRHYLRDIVVREGRLPEA